MSTIAPPSTPLRPPVGGDDPGPSLIPHRPRPFGVHSEAGVLRTVVLDTRVGSADDELTAAFAIRGVRVLPLDRLLADVLASRHLTAVLAGQLATLEASSPLARRRIASAFRVAGPDEAARMLLRGIPATDRDRDPRSPERARYLVPPLPESRSLRQPVVAVGPRPLTALVSGREGRRSVALMSAVGRWHPAFTATRPRRYAPDPQLRRTEAAIDGDDVQLAPDGSVVVGVGQRTSLHGARQLALSVLDTGVPRVVVVSLTQAALDRLDRLVAFLGIRTALVDPVAMSDDVTAWELRADHGDARRLVARTPRPFRDVLPGLLDQGARVHLVPDERGAHGPQHFLVLEPGSVLTAAGLTDPTSVLLQRAGIEVAALADDHGHAAHAGGLRRLALPVQRDALTPASGPTAL